MATDERIAPDGAIWVCGACGKTAKDRYGFEGEHSLGWDESCAMNAILCDERTVEYGPDGRAISAAPFSAYQAAPEGTDGIRAEWGPRHYVGRPPQRWRPTHRHYKGGHYRVIAEGHMEATLEPVIVYDSALGETWVRPRADFYSTDPIVRFTPIPVAPDVWEAKPVSGPAWENSKDPCVLGCPELGAAMTFHDAEAENKRLEAEVDRLREALATIASCQSFHENDVVALARAALAPKEEGGR